MSGSQIVIIKKVKKSGHGDSHGGSWKVAYADFVTAMMAFFLLMWLISMVSPEKRAQVSNYFKEYNLFEESGSSIMDYHAPAPSLSVTTPPATPPTVVQTIDQANEEIRERYIEEIKREIEEKLGDIQDQILIRPFEHGVRIEVMDKDSLPMFPLGSALPTEAGRRVLGVIARILDDCNRPVALEGHTDSLHYSKGNYSNWELSTERASAARILLEQNGLDPARLIRVAGFAATVPLIAEDTLDPRNRRISILIYTVPVPPGS